MRHLAVMLLGVLAVASLMYMLSFGVSSEALLAARRRLSRPRADALTSSNPAAAAGAELEQQEQQQQRQQLTQQDPQQQQPDVEGAGTRTAFGLGMRDRSRSHARPAAQANQQMHQQHHGASAQGSQQVEAGAGSSTTAAGTSMRPGSAPATAAARSGTGQAEQQGAQSSSSTPLAPPSRPGQAGSGAAADGNGQAGHAANGQDGEAAVKAGSAATATPHRQAQHAAEAGTGSAVRTDLAGSSPGDGTAAGTTSDSALRKAATARFRQQNPDRPAVSRAQAAAAALSNSSSPGRSLQRCDLLVAIPSAHDRLPLVQGSRVWRQGVPTYVALNWDLPVEQHEDAVSSLLATGHPYCLSAARNLLAEHSLVKAISPLLVQANMTTALETYGAWEDTWRTIKPGDTRAAITPFLAHASAPAGSYKWMLYGDDDTVFFIDNVLAMLDKLDHTMPYFLTDHLWYPDQHDRKVHPNRAAPRCLPCGYQDPLHTPGDWSNVPAGSFRAPEGCPCNLTAACLGADNPGYWGHDCRWRSGEWWEPNPGWWYFEHGGAGAIVSVGLMETMPLERVKDMWQWGVQTSGDSAFMNAVFYVGGILPTDPGFGYYRPGVTLFDPGWHGDRVLGPEDAGTLDLGNDPVAVLQRLQDAAAGDSAGCDAACTEALERMVTCHIRARYVDASGGGSAPHVPYADVQQEHRPSVQMQWRLATAFDEFSSRRNGHRTH